jgi:hypothetical protein
MQSLLNIATGPTDIILIQEPWISHQGKTISHPSFQVIILQSNEYTHKPRTLTIISATNPYIKCTPGPDLCNDPDLQLLDISTSTIPTISIANIYNKKISTQLQMNRTIERSLINITPGNRFLLAGDFNLYHPMWNTNKKLLRAEALITYIERNDLTLYNESNTPTYISRSGNSWSTIDLLLSSHSISHHIINWAIDEENRTGSDHLPIKFDITSDQFETVPSPLCQKYNWKRTDWGRLQKNLLKQEQELKSEWENIFNHTENNAVMKNGAELITSMILDAVNNSTPLYRPSRHAKWWRTYKLSDLRTVMNRDLRHWKQNQCDLTWLTYKTTRNKYFQAIREAKTESWTTFRTTLFPDPPTIHQREDIAQKPPVISKLLTCNEVKRAIKTSNPIRAPGPDGLSFLCI